MTEKRQFIKYGLAALIPSAFASRAMSQTTSTDDAHLRKILSILTARMASAESLNPAGMVIAYAGSNVPRGWLNCDGREYSKTAYVALYAAIGDMYATQINPTNGSQHPAPAAGFFRVPDYRGVFLRAAGVNSLGQTTHVGGWQDDATSVNGLKANTDSQGQHNHGGQTGNDNLGDMVSINSIVQGYASTQSSGMPMTSRDQHTHTISNDGIHSHNVNFTAGDIETRPQNKGVSYLIKAI